MQARTSFGLALGLALALLLGSARAEAAPDPRLKWRSLESPHFVIHFPDGAYRQALGAADRLERAHALLSPLLNHRPRRRTEVVITDSHDDANGMATSFPFPQIHARLAPPGADSILGHYDDYLWILLVHEYVHVLHLDHTEGIPDLGNRIFGRLFSPNGYQPGWIVEGLATRYESLLSGKGRNHSARVDMMLRAQLLEGGELWRPGRLGAGPTEWPGATLWYLYGGRIWETIARESGESAPAKMTTDYAGRVLPFAYNLSAEAATGRGLEDYFSVWREQETGRLRLTLEAIESAGRREGERLTHLGRVVHELSPLADGSILFRASDGAHFPGIYRVVPGGAPERLHRQSGLGAFAVAPHGESLIFLAREDHQSFQFTTDLFARPLDPGSPSGSGEASQRLSAGLRATHLAISPTGDRIAWVAQRRGEMAVYLAPLHLPLPGASASGAAEVRLGPPRRIFSRPGTQLDRLSFCPEGDHLALSLHPAGGSWDLALLDLETATNRTTGDDGAPDAGAVGEAHLRPVATGPEEEIHPSFSPDHRFLVYSADREGVFDLFARDLSTLEDPDSRPRRLSRVRTGAFEPHFLPGGEALVYLGYTREGWDLFRLPLPATGLAGLAPEAEADPERRPSQHLTRPRVYPVHPYRPLATLRPHYWIPALGADARGTTLGLTTGGSDVVGRHSWSGSLWLGAVSREPGFGLAYRFAGSVPQVSAATSTYFGLAASTARDDGRLYFLQRVSSLSLDLDLSDDHYDRHQGLGLSLNLRRLSVRGEAPGVWAGEQPVFFPESIWFNQLSFYWSASTVHGFAESISAEEGLRLTLQAGLSSRVLGSASDSLDLSLYLHAYQPLPFARRHVLALRVRASVGIGGFGGRARYLLGGLGLHDPFRSAITGAQLPATVLRGFPSGTFAGNALLATTGEYRFPLWEIDRGQGFLPLFFRRVWGAVFADLGTAGDPPEVLLEGQLGASVGAELRVELTVGYLLPLQLRLGLARGLTTGGITEPFAGLGGVF